MRRAGLGSTIARGLPVFVLGLALAVALMHSPLDSQAPGPGSDTRGHTVVLPDVTLVNQHGRPVHLYDDFVRDKTLVIDLMYTRCPDICPENAAALENLSRLLGERMGNEVAIISLTVDPLTDTPERLKRYWEAFGSKPGWLFLTGDLPDVDKLRRELGGYDLDPQADADPARHAGFITVLNHRANRWTALPLHASTARLMGAIRSVSHVP